MSNCNVISGIIKLKEQLAIDYDILGKSYEYKTEDLILNVIFPTLEEIGNEDILDRRKLDEFKLNIYRNYQKGIQWGSLFKSAFHSKHISGAFIDTICFKAELLNNEYSDLCHIRLHKLLNRLIEHIQIQFPAAIHPENTFTRPTDYCDIDYFVFKNNDITEGSPTYIRLSGFPTDVMQSSDMVDVFNKLNLSPTLPYMIYNNARRFYSTDNFRETILNCAMSIEIALKLELRRSLQYQNHDRTDALMYWTDGLPKLKKLAQKLKYEIQDYEQLKENIFNLRNKIVHAGKDINMEQAEKSIEITRKFLVVQNIPMFEPYE